MKIYYAHPQSWYGTDREKEDVAAIKKAGHTCINPNGPKFKAAVDEAKLNGKNSNEVMAIFFDTIGAAAQGIAYRTFDDGYLGAGVAGEILQAFIQGKTIYQLLNVRQPHTGFEVVMFEQTGLRASFGPRVLTVADTRDRLKRGVM